MNIACSLLRWEHREECRMREQRLVRSTSEKEDDMCLQKVNAETHSRVWLPLTNANVVKFRGVQLCLLKGRLRFRRVHELLWESTNNRVIDLEQSLHHFIHWDIFELTLSVLPHRGTLRKGDNYIIWVLLQYRRDALAAMCRDVTHHRWDPST